MKKLLLPVLGFILLGACQDTLDRPTEAKGPEKEIKERQKGQARMVVSSPLEIACRIADMGDNENPAALTRTLVDATYSDSEEPFVSLIEANRLKVMASLTPEQLDSINNDEDELEFCPADSVIADIQFAMLLNSDREIQVGEFIYKYLPNGVAYVHEKYADELKNIEAVTRPIKVTSVNVGQPMRATQNTNFIPIDYMALTIEDEFFHQDDCIYEHDPNEPPGNSRGGDDTSPLPPAPSGLRLSNGITIPAANIREIGESDSGDANWFQGAWNGLWGKHVVALNKFEKKRQLNLNFYDQNYFIYANIGTKLKMQKKVCGIWWNVKAPEMEQGWDAVCVEYELPKPIQPDMFTYPGMSNPTVHTKHNFPFTNEECILLKIPLIDYNFTIKDLNKAFNTALNKALDLASNEVKKLVKQEKKPVGLIIMEDQKSYIIYGPYSQHVRDKRSVESKFYIRWFPGEWEFGFSYGASGLELKRIKIDRNDGVSLFTGRVYGAIKYNGKWLAARISYRKKK